MGDACPKTGPNAACGTDPKATFNDLTNDGFPGGYCSVEPCTTASLCPIGASCGGLGGESPACWKNCMTDADCRAPDYKCWDIGALLTSGVSQKVCFLVDWPCAKAVDCPLSAPKCGAQKTCVP